MASPKINLTKLKSKLEVKGLKQLLELKKNMKSSTSNFHVDYESESLLYFVPHNYIPDFVLTFKDGRKMYIEMKGYLRQEDKQKMIAVKREHPDKDIRIVFQSNNKVYKNPNFRYSDWAEKYGYIYAIKDIPIEWFE